MLSASLFRISVLEANDIDSDIVLNVLFARSDRPERCDTGILPEQIHSDYDCNLLKTQGNIYCMGHGVSF